MNSSRVRLICLRRALVGVVLVAEGDALAVEAEEPLVGDADAVGVAREVGKHGARPGEGSFGIDHPRPAAHLVEPAMECAAVPQRRELAVAAECVRREERAQSVAILGAEHLRQCPHREEPVRGLCRPAPVGTQPSGGHDAVEMVVIEQRLAPGVQQGGDARLRLQFPIKEREQRGAGRVEEQLVKRGLILRHQRVERVRSVKTT